MRRIMAIAGGVIAATLAMYGPARGEDSRAISVEGRAVVLPPVAREYDRLVTTPPAGATWRPVMPSTVAAAPAARPALTPPPAPPAGTPLMQRIEHFRSEAYRNWFQERVRATAREHMNGASGPR